MVNAPVRNGTAVDLSGWRPEDAHNSFANTTVESIVLEVSHGNPKLRPGAKVGVWCRPVCRHVQGVVAEARGRTGISAPSGEETTSRARSNTSGEPRPVAKFQPGVVG
jgi:hypothetical protein